MFAIKLHAPCAPKQKITINGCRLLESVQCCADYNKLHTFHYDQKNYQKITMADWLQESA